jgi:endonuclease/exonuclease/phosphatase (EEP) superfamily protein YafD
VRGVYPKPMTRRPRSRTPQRLARVVRVAVIVLLWTTIITATAFALRVEDGERSRRWLDHLASAHHLFGLAALTGCLILIAMHRRRARWIALGLGIGLLMLHARPYWHVPVAPRGEQAASSIRVISLNARGDRDTRAGLRRLVNTRDPDVMLLQEATHFMESYADEVSETYPHQIRSDWGFGWDTMILSRIEMTPRTTAPGRRMVSFNEGSMQSAVLHLSDADLLVATCHLVRGTDSTGLWKAGNTAAGALARRVHELANESRVPALLSGDFNGGPLSARGHAIVADGHWSHARRPGPFSGTWPSRLPAPLRLQPDQVFVSEGVKIINANIGPDVGSDHRPIIIDLVVLPHRSTEPPASDRHSRDASATDRVDN